MVADPATFSGLCDQEGHWPSSFWSPSSNLHENKKETDRRAPPQMVTDSLQLWLTVGGRTLTVLSVRRRAGSSSLPLLPWRVAEWGKHSQCCSLQWTALNWRRWGSPESFQVVHPNPGEADTLTLTHVTHLHRVTRTDSHTSKALTNWHTHTHPPGHPHIHVSSH